MKCKQGQMAFIKKSLRKENIGLVVECTTHLGYFSRGDKIPMSGEFWYAPDSDDYWMITSASGSIETLYGKSKVAYTLDSWLTPIDPDILDKDESEELEDNLELLE